MSIAEIITNISIHLMLLFIVICGISADISIHPMLLFICCTSLQSRFIKSISIHPMLLFIPSLVFASSLIPSFQYIPSSLYKSVTSFFSLPLYVINISLNHLAVNGESDKYITYFYFVDTEKINRIDIFLKNNNTL